VIGLIATLTLAGLGTGRLVRWMMQKRPAEATPPVTPYSATRDEPATRLVGFRCSLGDVVLLPQGDEAWLAGALLLRERAAEADESGDAERTVAILYVAPDRGGDRAIYARGAPSPSLDWLLPVAEGSVLASPEPPSAIELRNTRFERVRRIPLSVVRAGVGTPDLGAFAVVAEYEGGAGGRLLVIKGSTESRAWVGHRLEEGMFDVLPAK
jgi:hypothetical protein